MDFYYYYNTAYGFYGFSCKCGWSIIIIITTAFYDFCLNHKKKIKEVKEGKINHNYRSTKWYQLVLMRVLCI